MKNTEILNRLVALLGWSLQDEWVTKSVDINVLAHKLLSRTETANVIAMELALTIRKDFEKVDDFSFLEDFCVVLERSLDLDFAKPYDKATSWDHTLNGTRLHESNAVSEAITYQLRDDDTLFSPEEFYCRLRLCYCIVKLLVNSAPTVKVKNFAQLEALGLPIDTAQLRKLVESSGNCSELFLWKDSDHGLDYWLGKWFSTKKTYVVDIYKYLNNLDPDLKLKQPKKM